jgi:regulator of protease activity HflC (stomatin/prohibitin superfamily)
MFNYNKTIITPANNSITTLNTTKLITHIILAIIFLILFFGSIKIIDAGERGTVLRLGNINRIMEPGLNFKIAFIEKVIKQQVRTEKQEVEASAASKDLQIVTSNIAIQYNIIPEEIGTLYQEVGTSYKSRIIDPAIQDAIKATTANYTAEQLITKRASVSEEMETVLRQRLAETHINVSNVDIVNFDFSPSFNESIEKKVTAEQDALAAQNKLEQVKFEAQQKIEKAKADAESIRIQAQAINSQGGADYVALQAIDKWNGILPTQMIPGGTVPFINVNK